MQNPSLFTVFKRWHPTQKVPTRYKTTGIALKVVSSVPSVVYHLLKNENEKCIMYIYYQNMVIKYFLMFAAYFFMFADVNNFSIHFTGSCVSSSNFFLLRIGSYYIHAKL